MTTSVSTSPVSSAPSPPAAQPGGDRLLSLDALRGFDMFWIIGGRDFLLAAAGMVAANESLGGLNYETHHATWNGYTFYDLIFPLFVFLVGVALPFSLSKRIERGESLGRVYWKICRRTVLLVLLGLICNNKLLLLDFDHLRYPSVLGRIGLAYFFAAIITLHTSVRGRVAWMVLILLGYWVAMTCIPVPNYGPGKLDTPGATLADYVDHIVLPARGGNWTRNMEGGPRFAVGDPEGILSTIPAIATALMGVLAGGWLRDSRRRGYVKAGGLLLAGAVCWGLARLWDPWFPIQKHLWTSSFVLWTGAWSLFLLGLFYLVIDVWGWRKWAFFFVVIGMNAITIYALTWVDFRAVGQLLFSHAPLPKVLLSDGGRLVMEWVFLYVLYRNRIFLRL